MYRYHRCFDFWFANSIKHQLFIFYLDRRGMVLSVNNPSYIITTPQTPTVNIDPGYVVPSQQFVQQGQMINPPNYVQGNVNYPQYDVNYSQPPPVYQQNIANKY